MALTQLPQGKQTELEKILDALKATVDRKDNTISQHVSGQKKD